MPYDILNDNWTPSPFMERLLTEKKTADELQKRKHEDWDGNYELYRNKVKTNRLTQRQAVNIPLMKETVKTLLAEIDDSPNVEWKEREGDEQKELYFQEIWNSTYRENKFELIDILDKKNVLLYGLSTKKLNLDDQGVSVEVLDPFDIVLDPLTNAWDLESARFIIHKNIFRTVREILADDRYMKEGKEELKLWADSSPGITQSSRNKEEWEKKMERLKSMGVSHQDFPLFAGGDRVINLTEHYTNIWNKGKFEKRVVVYAEDKTELLNELLDDLIGVDFWPFVMWSEDPEITDMYPDSIADTIRTPNKVLNIWISQLIENRTLKNFQMHWFLPGANYTPQTYTPGPGMMLPSPPGDDINKVLKPVEVSGLDDTLTAIQAITQIAERATGATAIQKGQPEQGQQTLGEVQILVGNAKERVIGMTKFYRMAWYELAKKWEAMMRVNSPKLLKLHKVSRTGKLHSKTVMKKDWFSEKGYQPLVRSSSEQENDSIKGIQKFQFILSQFPNNLALKKIAQKRMLEVVDLTPEELKQVEDAETQQPQQAPIQAQPAVQPQSNPEEQSLMSGIQQKIGELNSLTA